MTTQGRRCRRCQAEIPAERLEALPDTQVCIACSRTIGGEFDVTVVPVALSKGGSLKKNYGGWTGRKKRKPIEPEQG